MEDFIQELGAGIIIISIFIIMIFILWIRSMIANVNTDANTFKLNKQIDNLQNIVIEQNMMINDLRNQLNDVLYLLNNNNKS